MDDNDYIKAAVELADGWTISGSVIFPPSTVEIGMSIHNPSTWILDALAAQLVRQHLKRLTATMYRAWHRDSLKTIRWLVDNWALK